MEIQILTRKRCCDNTHGLLPTREMHPSLDVYKHVIVALLHRNGRPSACLTLVSSPSRGWADNHITLSPTINHIITIWCGSKPPGKQTVISGRVFQRLRDHLTGAKEKARPPFEQDGFFTAQCLKPKL